MNGGGRKRKPADILEQDRRSQKVSKKLVALREEITVSLGVKKLSPSPEVIADLTAYKRWKELDTLFQSFNLISSADNDKISQYCLLHSDESKRRRQLRDIEDLRLVGEEDPEYLDKREDRLYGEIRKTTELMNRIGKEIYLDPQARVSALPIPKKERPASLIEMSGLRILQKEG
jgi:phage terminase small subunit